MTVKIGEKEIELKYTFNSFKYMEEFSPTVLEDVDEKPFKIIPFLEVLLMGALNHDKKVKVTEDEVDEFLESFFVDGDVSQLIQDLLEALQNSNFFKTLQKNEK